MRDGADVFSADRPLVVVEDDDEALGLWATLFSAS